MMKRILTLAMLMPWLNIFSSCSGCEAANTEMVDTIVVDTVVVDTLVADVLFAGDFMQHSPQFNSALARGGGKVYDYSDCFEFVKPIIESADLAIGNLEVTLGGKPYSGYPCFSAPDEYLDALLDAGFDVMLTANNHCLDRRAKGLQRTVQVLDSLRVPHGGTYTSVAEREKTYPLMVEANGIRIALLNFTYGTNGIPNEAPNIVNQIDTAEIRADIMKAKAMEPDVLIAVPHWGVEYVTKENAEQRKLAEWLLAQGVDHIVGGHPHVVQPFNLQADSTGTNHLVAYSLGNFISNMSKEVTNGGLMLTLRLQKIVREEKRLAKLAGDTANEDAIANENQTNPSNPTSATTLPTSTATLRTSTTTLLSVTPDLIFNSRPIHNGLNCYRVVPESTPDSLLAPTERTARTTFYKLAHKIIAQ